MNCNNVREQLLEVAIASGPISPELQLHCSTCEPCASQLREIRQTMALLDEWPAPAPSPYFDVRLQARLREERHKHPASWVDWFRKPVLGVAATVLLALGIGLFVGGRDTDSGNPAVVPTHTMASTARGTAVGDLQYLEKHSDLLQDFDALDVLDNSDNGGNSGGTAN